jgi:hypothetical protein
MYSGSRARNEPRIHWAFTLSCLTILCRVWYLYLLGGHHVPKTLELCTHNLAQPRDSPSPRWLGHQWIGETSMPVAIEVIVVSGSATRRLVTGADKGLCLGGEIPTSEQWLPPWPCQSHAILRWRWWSLW